MTDTTQTTLRASGGYLTLFDGALRGHASVPALPPPGGAVTASASELVLHVHAELVPMRLFIRAGTADELAQEFDPQPSSSGAAGEPFTTVLTTTLELPTGRLLVNTSAGAQVSLEDFSAGTGTFHVRVRTRGGAAAGRIEDEYRDADTDGLIEQLGPEEWAVDLYR
ncbi:hypothetical protein [Terrabacter sp. C0L_2]|uniref:hypothetical protein n=1 Tax=Terrabacter sp. C0L_2 TaxID=3108389 RepID=UPI0017B5FEC0|nr:hypothetical protein [Dermatophilaceae bacterium]WVM95478.1 hypothetical protein U5C87_15930 [Terrabacter sp. C0L_2]